jgi:hypothetical protein
MSFGSSEKPLAVQCLSFGFYNRPPQPRLFVSFHPFRGQFATAAATLITASPSSPGDSRLRIDDVDGQDAAVVRRQVIVVDVEPETLHNKTQLSLDYAAAQQLLEKRHG